MALGAPVQDAGETQADSAQLFADLHQIHSRAGELTGHNLRQGLQLAFDDQGMVVKPVAGDWTWGLDVTGFGSMGEPLSMAGSASPTATGDRVTYSLKSGAAGLEEWYVNGADGVEHGFTLQGAAAGAESYGIDFDIRGGLRARINGSGRDVYFHDAASAGQLRVSYTGLLVFDATGRELHAHFTQAAGALQLKFDVRDAVFPVTVDPVVRQGYIKAKSSEAGDHFGGAIAMDGDLLVVGARDEDSDSVGVDGNTTNNNATQAGSVYVYLRTNGTWFFDAYLKASNTDVQDLFGSSVAISKDILVVGAPTEDSAAFGVNGDESDNSLTSAGAAYVFRRSAGTWSQTAYLKAPYPDASDLFGTSVSISGETIAVGAPFEDSNATGVGGNGKDDSSNGSGAVFVFRRTAGVWSQEAYVKSSNTGQSDQFGVSVAIDKDLLVVGATGEDSAAVGTNGNQGDNSFEHAGAAYVYRRTGSTWSQVSYLKASNTGFSDNFGTSVGIYGKRLIVGAPDEDSSATNVGGNQSDNSTINSGAAYVFEEDNNQWLQSAYLKASNPMNQARFGTSVAIGSEACIVGAFAERSPGYGVNGKQLEDINCFESGAAYVFGLGSSSWSPWAYLKASDEDPGDRFGSAVALSGKVVAVGAPHEDGSGFLTNGDPTSNGKIDSGSAEVFDLEANCGASRYGTWAGANIADLYSIDKPVGGQTFTLYLTDFAADGPGLMAISGASANTTLLGGNLLVNIDPNISFLRSILVTGGQDSLTIPMPTGLAGLSFYVQAAAVDLGQLQGFAFTTGLKVTVCP